jgi:hypothetical protein
MAKCPPDRNRSAANGLNHVNAKEIVKRVAPWILAVALAGAMSGCGSYYSRTYETGPSYAYAPAPGYSSNYAYAPQYSNETPASRYDGYSSKWDYSRNYGGTYHPGPEQYP